MVQDANKLVVFGSQLIGVIIVIVGLLTQQSKLRSPRPTGGKPQITAGFDRSGDRFAHLWDDPLDDLVGFEKALKQSSGVSAPTDSASPSDATALTSSHASESMSA